MRQPLIQTQLKSTLLRYKLLTKQADHFSDSNWTETLIAMILATTAGGNAYIAILESF